MRALARIIPKMTVVARPSRARRKIASMKIQIQRFLGLSHERPQLSLEEKVLAFSVWPNQLLLAIKQITTAVPLLLQRCLRRFLVGAKILETTEHSSNLPSLLASPWLCAGIRRRCRLQALASTLLC